MKTIVRKIKSFLALMTCGDVRKIQKFIGHKCFNYNEKIKEKKHIRAGFRGKYEFIDRKKDAKSLIIIVAGFQGYLWEEVFGRIKKYAPNDYDVCVVVPQGDRNSLNILKDICVCNKWSYLRTRANKLALAQNLAIREHPKAQYIFKFDEDIFIGDGYFEGIRKTYETAVDSYEYNIGMVVPVINVNGATSRILLEEKQEIDKWIVQFGKESLVRGCEGDKIYSQKNPEAARFLWDISLPFDETVTSFNRLLPQWEVCPHRFSIGAIFFSRRLWENMGGFEVTKDGILGVEEGHLCNYLMDTSQVIIIAKGVFAGHFGFIYQKEMMKRYWDDKLKVCLQNEIN